MVGLKTKDCLICSTKYQPTGNCSKFCKICAPEQARLRSLANDRKYRLAKGKLVGVGKGGANAKGKNDSQYKTGIVYFEKSIHKIKNERRYCNRCHIDLKNVGPHFWCVHHIDHDRTNNVPENWELLCKKCHQIEHKCWENFPKPTKIEGATTN